MQAAKMSSPEAAEAVGDKLTQSICSASSLSNQSAGDAQRFGPVNGAAMSKYLGKQLNELLASRGDRWGSERAGNMKALAGACEADPGVEPWVVWREGWLP
jgi:hypothetical protein